MTDRSDAIDLLTHDHQQVEKLFGQYEETTDTAERTRIAHQVVHDLAVHGEIEELLLYPRVRRALPDGNKLASDAVDEHLEIKQTLNDIDKMTADDQGFDRRMRELIAEVRHHVEEEENEMFPRFREALSQEDLLELGSALRGAKSVVPTRPHPNAPTGPIGKMVVGPPVALVDRVRDAMRSYSDKARR